MAEGSPHEPGFPFNRPAPFRDASFSSFDDLYHYLENLPSSDVVYEKPISWDFIKDKMLRENIEESYPQEQLIELLERYRHKPTQTLFQRLPDELHEVVQTLSRLLDPDISELSRLAHNPGKTERVSLEAEVETIDDDILHTITSFERTLNESDPRIDKLSNYELKLKRHEQLSEQEISDLCHTLYNPPSIDTSYKSLSSNGRASAACLELFLLLGTLRNVTVSFELYQEDELDRTPLQTNHVAIIRYHLPLPGDIDALLDEYETALEAGKIPSEKKRSNPRSSVYRAKRTLEQSLYGDLYSQSNRLHERNRLIAKIDTQHDRDALDILDNPTQELTESELREKLLLLGANRDDIASLMSSTMKTRDLDFLLQRIPLPQDEPDLEETVARIMKNPRLHTASRTLYELLHIQNPTLTTLTGIELTKADLLKLYRLYPTPISVLNAVELSLIDTENQLLKDVPTDNKGTNAVGTESFTKALSSKNKLSEKGLVSDYTTYSKLFGPLLRVLYGNRFALYSLVKTQPTYKPRAKPGTP